jgi:hypothetical protein
MQGRNQFQGGVPSNMNFPTEAYVGAHAQAYRDVGQAYANAAQMEAQAQSKMVSDLAQGAVGAFSAYKQGADAKKDFSANMAMLKSPSYQKVLGLSPEEATSLQTDFAKIQGDSGYGAANKQADMLFKSLFDYNRIGQQIQGHRDVANIQANAAFERAKLRDKDDQFPGVPFDATNAAGIDSIFSGTPSQQNAGFDPMDVGYGRNPFAAPMPSPTRTGVADLSPDVQEIMNMYRLRIR